jgi:hypothetical protein
MLPFEAQALSKVPSNVPFIKSVASERKKLLRQAQKENWSAARYEREVKDIYNQGSYTKLSKRGIVYDPWKMLRRHEDNFKARHPEYQSPWKKRQRVWRDFLAKAEVTIERQQKKK